jgi:tetratricopeptide (TPR) repeat protein
VRGSDERRQFMKRMQWELALELVTLVVEILDKKTDAKVEDFNGRPMPATIGEQAADLLRHALSINPHCELAHYNLGIVIYYHDAKPQIIDNLGELLWSNQKPSIAAVFYRRAIKGNPDSACVLTELGILIASAAIDAIKSDFVDGIMPGCIFAQGAILYRRANIANPLYSRSRLRLAHLIEVNLVTAEAVDFDDNVIPGTAIEQAAKLYRQVIAKNINIAEACGLLSSLIYRGLVSAIVTDFPELNMPATMPEQVLLLFRIALNSYNENRESLIGMAGLIASHMVKPNEEDCKVLEINSKASAAEQAAAIYRKVMRIYQADCDALIGLGELILAGSVKPVVSDTPGFQNLLPEVLHLSMMMREVFKVRPNSREAQDLLNKADLKEKEGYEKESARIAVERTRNDERRYQEIQARLAIKEKPSGSSDSTKRKGSVDSLTLFSKQKTQRVDGSVATVAQRRLVTGG